METGENKMNKLTVLGMVVLCVVCFGGYSNSVGFEYFVDQFCYDPFYFDAFYFDPFFFDRPSF